MSCFVGAVATPPGEMQARVGDRDIDAAKARPRSLHRARQRVLVDDICLRPRDALVSQLAGKGGQPLALQADQHRVRSQAHDPPRGLGADAARGTGDQDRLSNQQAALLHGTLVSFQNDLTKTLVLATVPRV